MPNLKNKKVIKDQQGQRKYPGRVTEIQGDTMATTGYGDIPLYVVPNVGNPMVVPANSGNRVFPGARSFTEYPIAKNGGWLEKYGDGGETDPPVNLRSASTQLTSPVSTQAPEVPLNKTGWDWVKQKYENRQPSDWNMLMMDKSGSYVDSGVDPFSLMLTAPQQVIKAASLPFKQSIKNNYEGVKSAGKYVEKLKNQLSDASSSTKNVIIESIGELKQGEANRKSIKKGNEWLHNWIKDPATQVKIDSDLNNKLEFAKILEKPEDVESAIKNIELIRSQSKNFKPNSKEYSLLKQFDENLQQYLSKDYKAKNIHNDNLGVSYQHNYSPEVRNLIEKGEYSAPEKYGSWISRNPLISQPKRTSIAVHEGTHDWISADAFKKSGMRNVSLKMTNPEIKEDFLKWEQLRLDGKNPAKTMGEAKSYQAYLANPTEMHARIMQLRKEFVMSPDKTITPQFSKKIIDFVNKGSSKVDPDFLKVIDNDPKKLSELFNRFWTAAPYVGAGYLGTKVLQKNK